MLVILKTDCKATAFGMASDPSQAGLQQSQRLGGGSYLEESYWGHLISSYFCWGKGSC